MNDPRPDAALLQLMEEMVAANGNFYNVVSAADSGTPVTDEAAPNYVAFRNPQVSGDAVGHRIIIHATADAEL